MIEFKADCGHTVRAKDEDAGKVVRCAYCGREAQVPQDDQDELDFLFSEVASESTAGSASPKTVKRSRKSDRAGMPFGASRTAADPFAVVKKMAYVAAVLICVIFVGKKYAWPMFNDAFLVDDKPAVTKSPPPDRPARITDTSKKPKQSSRRFGFLREDLSRRGNQGVYVDAIPDRTTAYYREVTSSGRGLDWLASTDAKRMATPGAVDLTAGTYTFAVTLPINDPQLMKNYKNYNYKGTRRSVEDETANKKADKAADEFFRPDGATKVGAVSIRGQKHIVRQYEVTVYENEWAVLTPQFVPSECSLADLKRFRSDSKLYGFDDDDVEGELDYHGVDERIWPDLLSILHRFGAISYPVDETGEFHMFEIDPMTGVFSAKRFESEHHRGSLGER